MAEENLTLIASVQEDFRDPLDELRDSLVEVGLIAEEVFPIDIDARGTSDTLAELEAIEQQVERIDDDVDITSSAVGGGVSVADGDGGGGGRAMATSGGTNSGFLTTNDLRRLREQFGKAFDESTLIDRGGEVTFGGQLLEGGLSDNVDRDGLVRAILDTDSAIGLDTLRKFESDDVMDVSEAFEELADAELLDMRGRGSFMDRMRRISPKMGDFYKALAAILPLLFVYIGALPAVIGALGGLAAAAIGAAGALAALGGLAFMGLGMEDGEFSMENLTDALSDVRDSFIESFEPLANRLAPMAEDALEGVDRLFNRLADAGDALLRLREEARALGGYLIGVLPTIVEDFATLGDIASPIFADLAAWLEDADLIDAFAGALGQALPMLSKLMNALVALMPVLFEISLAFLAGAAYITEFFSAIFQVIDVIPGGLYLFGALVTTLLTLYSVVSIVNMVSGMFTTILGGLGLQSTTTAGALSTLSMNMQQYGIVTGLATFATNNLTMALGMLASMITLGLAGGMMLTMIDRMDSLKESTSDVTDQLKNFRSVSNNLNGPSMNMGGGGGTSGPTYTSFTDNRQFAINANNSEDADRAAQALSFNTSYEAGKNADKQFTTN